MEFKIIKAGNRYIPNWRILSVSDRGVIKYTSYGREGSDEPEVYKYREERYVYVELDYGGPFALYGKAAEELLEQWLAGSDCKTI